MRMKRQKIGSNERNVWRSTVLASNAAVMLGRILSGLSVYNRSRVQTQASTCRFLLVLRNQYQMRRDTSLQALADKVSACC